MHIANILIYPLSIICYLLSLARLFCHRCPAIRAWVTAPQSDVEAKTNIHICDSNNKYLFGADYLFH